MKRRAVERAVLAIAALATLPACARVLVPGADAGPIPGLDGGDPDVDAASADGGNPPGTDAAGPPGTDAVTPPGTDAAPPGTDAATPGTDAGPPPPVCGNGVLEGMEPCDDGNDGDQTDDCLDGCIAAFCGDGFLRVGGTEACDDGNPFAGDGCSPTCAVETACTGTPFGPDTFGYSGCASTPALLPCPDISVTGTVVSLGDDTYTSVPVGFTFDLYGVLYTTMNIGSNGKLVPTSTTYINSCIPTTEGAAIYPWWDDLYPPAVGSTVRYATTGVAPNRTFEVQWVVQHFSSSPSTIDVRVVLYEGTNDIDVCYVDTIFGTIDDNGATATAGIQGGTVQYLQYSCSSAVLTTGLLLRYDHP